MPFDLLAGGLIGALARLVALVEQFDLLTPKPR